MRKTYILVGAIFAAMTVSVPSGSADTSSNSFDPRSASPFYEVFGSSFGCVVSKSNGTSEVRLTTKRSVKRAKRMIQDGRRVRGVKIGSVRLVHKSQSLLYFLTAWQFASNSLASQSFGAFDGASKWISSPTQPLSRSSCRSVVVSVYSYPGHTASQAELDWANSVVAAFPRNVVADIRTVPSAPGIPQ